MRARTVLVGLVGAAYVAGCHWLMTSAPDSRWNAVVVIGPMLGLVAFVAARRGPRLVAGIAGLGLVALLFQAWRGGGLAPATLYLAQHVAIHAALAVMFALTLRPGQEPLVTALARRVHDGLSPGMASYSRKVTVAWIVYFVLMAATSVALFAFAPFDAWAVFANLATPLAMVLMFVGEYLLRYRLHPEFERATLADAMNAYSRRHAAPLDRAP
ncbi:MAG: hypothetical protein K8R60_08395 [Burkholderiales bacterium]|nr:hypothetical protein [Burkholderiales bacterium]